VALKANGWKLNVSMPGGSGPKHDPYTLLRGITYTECFTLWLFNIAMENGPFIDGLPGFTY